MKKLLALFIALLSATATMQAQTARDITAQERQQMVRYLINRMRPLPIPNKGNAQPKYQYYYTPTPVTWNEWAAVLEKKTYGPQGKGNTPMIRLVAVVNYGHWNFMPTAQIMWDFFKQFRRDPETRQLLWNGRVL